jgi:serine/threonine protein kinase
MMKEAQAAGILSHPNIVTIFDVGEEEDTVYIVMEYLEGIPLDEKIKGNKSIHAREVLSVVEQVGSALDFAHSKGIIHRDVKPANIMKTVDNRAVLMDFGIAWMFGPDVVEKGTLIGSPIYMSPEQIDGQELTSKSDIYSLATVVFELLTGYRPYAGETFNEIVQAKYENKRLPLARLNPALPPGMEQFFDRALSADPEKRYANGDDLLKGLRAAIYSSPVGASFLTSTHHPLTMTQQRRLDEFMPENAKGSANERDPHMAETMMVDRDKDKDKGDTEGGTQAVAGESDLSDTHREKSDQPKVRSDIRIPDLPPRQMTQAGTSETPKYTPPKPSIVPGTGSTTTPGKVKSRIEKTTRAISDKRRTLKFQSAEDVTVAGKRKLIQDLKQTIGLLERSPDDIEKLLDAGVLYMRLGKFHEAKAYFKRVMKINWECIDAYVAIAQLYTDYKMKDFADDYWAIAEWLSERQIGKLHEEDYYYLGRKLEKFNLIKGAITIWEEAGALRPWHLDTWKELSRYYLQMKDYAKAKIALQHVTELSKFDAMAWRNLAVCYQNTKDYHKALNAWEKALRLESKGEGGARARKQIRQLKRFLNVR